MKVRTALNSYKGELRWDEPMSHHTSLGVGGPAEVMVFPSNLEEVVELVKRAEGSGIPLFPLGCGSNLLVKDGGIDGIVLNLTRLSSFRDEKGECLWAEGGISYPRLSAQAQERGLSGLEFAIGIPGTVGGAVVMNAGIPDRETMHIVKELTLVGKEGTVVTLPRESIPFGYRSVKLPWGIVVGARFVLQRSTPQAVEEQMRLLLSRRRETQPLSYPNVGSVFKNPPGDSAGRCIESVGLKGTVQGGAQISTRHANFIVNRAEATAADVLRLVDLARQSVRDRLGIDLEPEVRIVGVDASDAYKGRGYLART